MGDEPETWTAYNDLAGDSDAPATSITDAETGNLIDFETEVYLPVTVSVVGKKGIYGALSGANTDAYGIFNGKVNGSDYLLYENGDHVFTFRNLNTSGTYRFVHFGNRAESNYNNKRYVNVIISGVRAFTTNSSNGVSISTTSMYHDTARYDAGNNDEGYVAAWTDIELNSNEFVVTVKGDPGNEKHYSNVIMLQRLS